LGDYDVIFRTSISSAERTALFLFSRALLYTPDREHFGIVPLEVLWCFDLCILIDYFSAVSNFSTLDFFQAMQVGLPVIAVNSGGPTETVAHGETGFLCAQDPHEFADAMFLLASDSTCKFVGIALNRR
jgi:alpha-1,3/alpha-1,6-mannosyltransferase